MVTRTYSLTGGCLPPRTVPRWSRDAEADPVSQAGIPPSKMEVTEMEEAVAAEQSEACDAAQRALVDKAVSGVSGSLAMAAPPQVHLSSMNSLGT